MEKRKEDPYTVLGVQKSSSSSEIRSAYRKLAMKWHPDKQHSLEDQAKAKFQGIQEAYSVLSDDKKRVLYDSGLYDEGDDEGMQGFMSEMVAMMSTSSKVHTNELMNELKDMFDQMVDSYTPQGSSSGSNPCSMFGAQAYSSSSCSNATSFYCEPVEPFFKSFSSSQNFCIGHQEGESARQKLHKKGHRRRKCPYDQGTRA
ncbi:uncharacterized protein LOC9651081 isoform X1 [Selaginella moellendorffii]|uniref:uncharacterized protein LOC9651081 isoform X1 n=1 Tax=Selaginella moellendorffii TaxID=88036 RepID=UPI000D1CF7DF|nr:uncharacterized protein LOC9651081 isoform X1 [Selaginella moellendorffii]|eukprot:XP_024518878.1 uncharacterized protein LOC9651081 isoform X1 [Selaginella moellendorffii]